MTRSQGWIQLHHLALRVDCPACRARAGEPCSRFDGEVLRQAPAHATRIHVAENPETAPEGIA